MKIDYQILSECNTDTNFIETLIPPSTCNGYNHQKNCNKVASTMQNALKDSFALGIIDKDKREIQYLNEFELLTQKQNISLLKHKTKPHYFIQIYPAIEKFILDSASEVNVSLEEYDLPADFDSLKKITKKLTSKKDTRLSQLFIELVRKEASQVVTLSNWIVYLKENTYFANIEILKTL